MAEEQEKKKPKATLIKQKKGEPPRSEETQKPEKKKVVVVKRKVVVVKKAVSEIQMQKGIAGRKIPVEMSVGTDKSTGSRIRQPQREFPATESRWKDGRQHQERTSKTGRPSGRSTFIKKRPDSTGAVFPSGRRTAAGKRPGGFVPSVSKTAETVTTEAKKAPGKKFFKTKRKSGFKYKHKEHQEKIISFKKKTVQKANPIPKEISIMEVITVSELARKMNLKASELISKLMGMGMMVTINQQIDAETAAILAENYGSRVNIVSLYDETIIETEIDREEDLKARPPIVTIMGHVDHGKTKLLDAIRASKVVESEFGGITQHIGAYTVDLPQGRIVFLDTPGHEAFTTMRARGAQVTDTVVLVVAAEDGVMPQTVEAINHAREADVPIIVAINKMDLPEANPDRVKQQLSEYDLIPEDWGGHTLFSSISALKQTGIKELLDSILLQAELLELKASYSCRAEGRIIESKIDLGRGIVATVLIQRGTLKIGDSFIAGVYPGKVRAMFNNNGEKVIEATPSIPIEILGFSGIPNAGDPFQVTESEKSARQVGMKRQELKKIEDAKNVRKITLDNLYDRIRDGEVRELKVIIKGDVHGSVEALQNTLEKLSTDEIRLNVIHASAGPMNDNDVMLASASNAIILGFNVRPTPNTQSLAESEKVEIRKYNVIYDVIDDIKAAMEGLLSPVMREESLGTAEVRNLFKVPKVGTVAGCHVTSGKIKRNDLVQIIRDSIEIYRGKIVSLKRFKEDAQEVETGFECGIGVENFNDLKVGDLIEAYKVVELAKKLNGGPKDVGTKTKES